MMSDKENDQFLGKFDFGAGSVVSIVGAGGKTSLMYRLAKEARALGQKVLITTSTRIMVPEKSRYDQLDLSGQLFAHQQSVAPGIYIGGSQNSQDKEQQKMAGVDVALLQRRLPLFDLLLIEADGAARKSLKGWLENEPVIVNLTSHTVGVVDIQSIGKVINPSLVHRLEIFTRLTGGQPGQRVSLDHLSAIIGSADGLFRRSRGKKILYLNKVETAKDHAHVRWIKKRFPGLRLIAGSLAAGNCHG
jgi:probable selenium-dependent hydroxylase accessory protein YqeC